MASAHEQALVISDVRQCGSLDYHEFKSCLTSVGIILGDSDCQVLLRFQTIVRGCAACASMLVSSIVLRVQSMTIVAGNRRVERKYACVCVYACMRIPSGIHLLNRTFTCIGRRCWVEAGMRERVRSITSTFCSKLRTNTSIAGFCVSIK
jgi:hypothetical protein